MGDGPVWNAGGITYGGGPSGGGVADGAIGGAAAGTSIWPGIGTIAGGLLGGLGSLFSGYSAKQAARDQMAFQERMSSTAHQREVEDLKKAGLNPVLSAMSGGASSPGGASWSMPNPGSELGASVSSSAKMMALELPALESSLRLQAAQRHLTLEQADKATADAAVSMAEAANVTADTDVRRMMLKKLETMLEPERAESVARASELWSRRALQRAQEGLIPHSARALDSQSALREAELPQVQADSSAYGLFMRDVGRATGLLGDLPFPRLQLRFGGGAPPSYGGKSSAKGMNDGFDEFMKSYGDLGQMKKRRR